MRATAFKNQCNTLIEQGNLKAAEQASQKSLEYDTQRTKIEPDSVDAKQALAIDYHQLGTIKSSYGDFEGGLQEHEEALQISSNAADYDSGNTSIQHDIAMGLLQVGSAKLMVKGDLQSAIESLNNALEAINKALAKAPDNPQFQNDYAEIVEHLALLKALQMDHEGAMKHIQECLAIRSKLVNQFPGNSEWQRNLAGAYHDLAALHEMSRNVSSAASNRQKALDILNIVAQRDLDNAAWQLDLSQKYLSNGESKLKQGDLTGAAKDSQRSIDIVSDLVRRYPGNSTLLIVT